MARKLTAVPLPGACSATSACTAQLISEEETTAQWLNGIYYERDGSELPVDNTILVNYYVCSCGRNWRTVQAGNSARPVIVCDSPSTKPSSPSEET